MRCFYGEALHSGADLKSDLKGVAPHKKITAAVLLMAFFLSGSSFFPVFAEDPKSSKAVTAEQLDVAIERVLSEREFQWRMPKEKEAEDEISRSVLLEFLEGFYRWVQKWVGKIGDWFRGLWPDSKSRGGSSEDSSFTAEKRLWYVLLGFAIVFLAVAFYFFWKRKHPRAVAIPAEPAIVLPDLEAENVLANQLPEDEWQSLARELLQRGELRLALRALFLATLANLSSRDLISIARFKSNRDYQRELKRRAYTNAELQQLFSENVSLFERTWYGAHQVNNEMISRFGSNQSKMRTLVQE